MDETENYLNSILQKRIGSVVNQSSFTKNGNTVTRLPQQQEKIESMPTVFRRKHQTVYLNSQNPSLIEARTSFISKKESIVQEKEPVGNHRVEYMAISKRIEKKKQTELISPTVDVTKYRTSAIIRQDNQSLKESEISKRIQAKSLSPNVIVPPMKKIAEKQEIHQQKQQAINKPRRRRIFNQD